jgi:hypothetical protein
VATPAVTVPVPNVVAVVVSVKVTVPVGVEPVTVAVNVVDPPKMVGLTLEVSPVLVAPATFTLR